MDSGKNPYRPGAGTPPPFLAGRDDILQRAKIALARVKNGGSQKSFIAVGLRGVGKTVILREINNQAETMNFETIFIEATDNINFNEELISKLRPLLIRLSKKATASHLLTKAIQSFKSFARTLKISYQEFSLEIEAEEGLADSGNLNIDLPDLFEAIGKAAKERNTAIAILIDEIQYVPQGQMDALIMSIHRSNQLVLPMIIFGAGLPQLRGKMGEAKSYAERLFDYPEIGALSKNDAQIALTEPVQQENVTYQREALNFILKKTKGYPYFLQEWGYALWETAGQSPFSEQDAQKASSAATQTLDEGFFRVRLDRTTPNERKYMHAMASLGEKAQRSGEIAKKLGINVNHASSIRSQLIAKGMVYSPHHGDTAFTVPLFADFMRREMGEFKKEPPFKTVMPEEKKRT